MEQHEAVPDVVTYSSLMHALVLGSRWPTALQLLDQFPGVGWAVRLRIGMIGLVELFDMMTLPLERLRLIYWFVLLSQLASTGAW